jgi:D-hexose-6-phosphate mutarotase
VLWLSGQSRLEPGQAIRGGVPVCFPWFSKHPTDRSAPPHGFARTCDWTLEVAREDAGGDVVLEMELAGEAMAPHWPHRFRARHRITIGAVLRLELEVKNTGPDAFSFEEALHAYFDVGDIREVTVAGWKARVSGRGQSRNRLRGLTRTDSVAGQPRIYPGRGTPASSATRSRRHDIVVEVGLEFTVV